MDVLLKSRIGKRWTLEKYLNAPEDDYFQIINGEKFMSPSPFYTHQFISRELQFLMLQHEKKHHLGEIINAPFDVILDEENIVQPDLIFIKKENLSILKKGRIYGSPDVLVEIISPASIKMDRTIKMKLYQRFEIPEYWIIDPANRSVEIFHLKNGEYELISFAADHGEVKSRELKNFKARIESFLPDINNIG